jgi:transposase-like protein
MGNRTYSPEFKLQVVLEALQSDGTDAEVARAYHIHPVTFSNWKKKLKENGSKAFGGGDDLKEKNDKIAKLERMVGKKEVEIALLKNFLGEKGDPRSP